MPQDQASGARARDFGYTMARVVAREIGAVLTDSARSNEAEFRGQRVVLKSARPRTSGIGVTEGTLARVDAVLAALGAPENVFHVYKIPVAWYREHMRRDVRPHSNVYHVGRREIVGACERIASVAVQG